MKILLINKWVAGATKGQFYYPGSWRDTFELACSLKDLGCDIEILTPKLQQQHFKRFQNEFGKTLLKKGIKHHFAKTYLSFGHNFGGFRLKMFFDELLIIRKSKPDIIQYMQFGPSLIYPFVKKTPIVYYSCDQFNHYIGEKEDLEDAAKSWEVAKVSKILMVFQNLVYYFIAKLWGSLNLATALKKGAVFILMHPKGYQGLKKKFGLKSSIFLIEKGVNISTKKFFVRKKEKKIKILFVGTTVNRKGIFDLLEAFKIVQVKNPNVELLIAGGAPDAAVRKLKRKIVTLGLKLRYFGPVSSQKRWLLFKGSHVFCLPSYQDAYPSAILEAMAAGLPVVTTWDIDTPIVNGKSGILVHAGDVSMLADALRRFIASPDLRQKIGKGGRIAVEGLAWSKQAIKLINLYQKILSR